MCKYRIRVLLQNGRVSTSSHTSRENVGGANVAAWNVSDDLHLYFPCPYFLVSRFLKLIFTYLANALGQSLKSVLISCVNGLFWCSFEVMLYKTMWLKKFVCWLQEDIPKQVVREPLPQLSSKKPISNSGPSPSLTSVHSVKPESNDMVGLQLAFYSD